MIQRYYNDVIRQVYDNLANPNKNIIMVDYVNDFSVMNLPMVVELLESKDVYFVVNELSSEGLFGAFEPFLDVICDVYRKYYSDDPVDFAAFMEECEVYAPHRTLLGGYFQFGLCVPGEDVLLQEVEFGQLRMIDAVASMLHHLCQEHPLLILINSLQYITCSSLQLLLRLVENPCANLGLVLGVNGSYSHRENLRVTWDTLRDILVNRSVVFHIGTAEDSSAPQTSVPISRQDYQRQLYNQFHLMDYEEAYRQFRKIENCVPLEDCPAAEILENQNIYIMYAHTAMLLGEVSRALELVKRVQDSLGPNDNVQLWESTYLQSKCYMYRGTLEKAQQLAEKSLKQASALADPFRIFKSELLCVQTQMSGWYNVFFFTKDIPIQDSLIEKLYHYNWQNHLAYILIYAFNSRPEEMVIASLTGEGMESYKQGVELAKDLDNAVLVYNAHQKCIMMASTGGMNHIALEYVMSCHSYLKPQDNIYEGRTYAGLGYNLSAIGENALAEKLYDKAICVFYKLGLMEDVAEIFYNHATNHIMMGHIDQAERDLQTTMKIIDKLHLNSLRVCNVSKLYGLLALTAILQGDRFNCERNLLAAHQFLSYFMQQNSRRVGYENIHDFANMDDDNFLYHFSMALLKDYDGQVDEAISFMAETGKYYQHASGNLFFLQDIFAQNRLALYQKANKHTLYEHEQQKYRNKSNKKELRISTKLLSEIHLLVNDDFAKISDADILKLLQAEAVSLNYHNLRDQMDFVSHWQKVLDSTQGSLEEVSSAIISYFVNRYSLDCGVYIYWREGEPLVLYNDTGFAITAENLAVIQEAVADYNQGFAASRIRDNLTEHMDVISLFDSDEICSFIMVPFLAEGKTTSLFMGLIRMKDNWHATIERFLLDETDLHFYSMLFRELEFTLARREHAEKISKMNAALKASSITDVLTGTLNRAGMYECIDDLVHKSTVNDTPLDIGVMFMDLDNFKGYNDRFGHDVGDIILKEMAKLFVKVAGDEGIVTRFGGDEFVILWRTADRSSLEASAKAIYAEIDSANGFAAAIEDYLGEPICVEASARITTSIGITYGCGLANGDSIEDLIKKADDSLYLVKNNGKGTYLFLE